MRDARAFWCARGRGWWDWTAIALTYLSQAAGPRWTGPAEWTDPLEADIYRGPPIKLEPGEYM
jgi:hypothetical protein